MQEQIKIGLLAVIAVTLIVNTLMSTGGNTPDYGSTNFAATIASPVSGGNPAAAGTQSNPINLNNPTNPTQGNPTNPTQVEPPVDPVANMPKTTMAFGKMEHDFGTVKQNSENTHLFEFTNTGDKPLQISSAKGSCGCTVPKYPTDPIPPGQTGEIEVVYKPGTQKDAQSKTVTLTANTEPITTTLRISANVVPE